MRVSTVYSLKYELLAQYLIDTESLSSSRRAFKEIHQKAVKFPERASVILLDRVEEDEIVIK